MERLIPPFISWSPLQHHPHLTPSLHHHPSYIFRIPSPGLLPQGWKTASTSVILQAFLLFYYPLQFYLSPLLHHASQKKGLTDYFHHSSYIYSNYCSQTSLCFLQGPYWFPGCQMQWLWAFCSTLLKPTLPFDSVVVQHPGAPGTRMVYLSIPRPFQFPPLLPIP